MARIVHLALKVEDLDKTTEFYPRVFGFREVPTQRVHHFAIEVDDVGAYVAELGKYGCQIISSPGAIPVKFRAPGGTVAELVPVGRYKKSAT